MPDDRPLTPGERRSPSVRRRPAVRPARSYDALLCLPLGALKRASAHGAPAQLFAYARGLRQAADELRRDAPAVGSALERRFAEIFVELAAEAERNAAAKAREEADLASAGLARVANSPPLRVDATSADVS